MVRELAKTGYQKDIDTYENPEAVEVWAGNIRSLFTPESNPIMYQREVEVEPNVYADIAVLYEHEYGHLRLVVNSKADTCFVIDSKRESSRCLSGFLQVSGRSKVFYTIETCCGYTE